MQLLYVIHFFILSDLHSAGSVSLGVKSLLQERETIGRMISSAAYAWFEERKKERARTREARERKKESGRERNGGIERGDRDRKREVTVIIPASLIGANHW